MLARHVHLLSGACVNTKCKHCLPRISLAKNSATLDDVPSNLDFRAVVVLYIAGKSERFILSKIRDSNSWEYK